MPNIPAIIIFNSIPAGLCPAGYSFVVYSSVERFSLRHRTT